MKKLIAISALGLAMLSGGASAACQSVDDLIGTTTLGPYQVLTTPSYTTSTASGCASASHTLQITKLSNGGLSAKLQQLSGGTWTTVKQDYGDIYFNTSHGTFRYQLEESRGGQIMFRGKYTHPSR